MDLPPLFPGLPDALGLDCLARVPATRWGRLPLVSRSWRYAVKSGNAALLRLALAYQSTLYIVFFDANLSPGPELDAEYFDKPEGSRLSHAAATVRQFLATSGTSVQTTFQSLGHRASSREWPAREIGELGIQGRDNGWLVGLFDVDDGSASFALSPILEQDSCEHVQHCMRRMTATTRHNIVYALHDTSCGLCSLKLWRFDVLKGEWEPRMGFVPHCDQFQVLALRFEGETSKLWCVTMESQKNKVSEEMVARVVDVEDKRSRWQVVGRGRRADYEKTIALGTVAYFNKGMRLILPVSEVDPPGEARGLLRRVQAECDLVGRLLTTRVQIAQVHVAQVNHSLLIDKKFILPHYLWGRGFRVLEFPLSSESDWNTNEDSLTPLIPFPKSDVPESHSLTDQTFDIRGEVLASEGRVFLVQVDNPESLQEVVRNADGAIIGARDISSIFTHLQWVRNTLSKCTVLTNAVVTI
eukprot:TRINITY_DN23300_c0_g1_i1.p1 TRINITY_DN23300_c0_g1~~TRINITY_DN23300_c0_g1_i1.p1  ORF type:complete len:470 (-),score=33.85 TRINITY_DN23300_c0_g1_i1:306-1715(-)